MCPSTFAAACWVAIGLQLIRLVGDWTKSQEALDLHIHSGFGVDPEQTGKLLSRLGFKTYGGNYATGLGRILKLAAERCRP